MLERCAQFLIKHEKLDGPVFYKLMAGEVDIDGNPVAKELLPDENAAENTNENAETTNTETVNEEKSEDGGEN